MELKTYLNIVILTLLVLIAKTTIAQSNKVIANKVSVSGIVKDSLTKINLNNALVAIYNKVSDRVLTTKTNKDGGFTILNLPADTALEMRITLLGYDIYKKSFSLKADKLPHDVGEIMLYRETLKTSKLNTIDVIHAQSSASTVWGSIKGKVRDSTYKYVLNSATVSVYNNVDSSLLKFMIPNEFGEFSLQKLPLNTRLKLTITHIGYSPHIKIFSLDTSKNTIDFDWINMHQNADGKNLLEEVKITAYAPVRMNGDTLEFNPRAFKMDANATAEDLMRRLPGMVIWGDGDITFNGKKIHSLLVDGKPFMGSSDFTTASQNLPEEVLDKVQIYSERDEKNPLDSTLNANLKLKEDKKVGYFGKVGAGYGSNDRFATDGMLNGYNKKLQVSTVGAFNNINKSANNINTLIRSNSYKGDGIGSDYQSDFKRAGINIGATVGTRFQYDFKPEVSERKNGRLSGDYFFKQNNETINSTRLTNTRLKTDSILSNSNLKQSTNRGSMNTFFANYLQKDDDYSLSVSTNAVAGQNCNTSQSSGEQTRTGVVGQLSNSNSLSTNQNIQRKIALSADFDYHQKIVDYDLAPKRSQYLLSNFTVGYKFLYEENKGSRHNLSSLVSAQNSSANKYFDRLYQDNNNRSGHILNIAHPNLKELLFGFVDLGGINLELGSQFSLNQNNTNAIVFDTDVHTKQYEKNDFLTSNSNEEIQDLQPRLSISKNFRKGLTNRYNKRFDIFIIPKLQYYAMRRLSTQPIQNFNYQYRKFIPSASLSYYNHQYGEYELSSSVNYDTKVTYPTVEHIAPLVDSANVWYIPKGNIFIKPENTNAFAWKMSLESRKSKNTYRIDFNVDGNFTKNKISDSAFYDNLGRRINYHINLNGNKYWHLGSHFRKAYSPNKSNTFRFNIWYNRYSYIIPQYLDAVLITSNNRNNNFDVEVAYSFLDIINVNAKQGSSFYRNLESTNSQQYEGLNNYTRFSGTLQLPKNLTWSTNINFNTNKAQNRPTVNYAIWNAGLTYRFMQGNNAEISFLALDLLKQNKSVINNTNQNVQAFGFDSVLQQYFIVSLAYYPRKFGK